MTRSIGEISPAVVARIAGYGYLAIILLGIFAEFFVRSSLVVSGDAVATTSNITANEFLYRVGVVAYLLMAIFDLLVALALYVFLKPVSESLSLLAAWLRLVHAIILAVVLHNLFDVLHLLSDVDYLAAIGTAQLSAQVMMSLEAFNNGWLIGLVFFGLHCLVLGYLVVRSGFIPKILGLLMMLAALGYLIDSFAHFLLANYMDYAEIFLLIVALPAIIAELSLCFWLLIKGAKSQQV